MIDLFIIGFACISIAAFASTKDNNKNKQDVIIEEIAITKSTNKIAININIDKNMFEKISNAGSIITFLSL